MKFRVLFTALALLALTSLTFAQPKMVSWDYPGDWVCDVPGARPMTAGECFDTLAPITPIPDGTVMNIVVTGPNPQTIAFPLNGAGVCGPGTFSTNYFFIYAANTVVLDVVYMNCHYWSRSYPITTDETFLMYQNDWYCECEAQPEYDDLGDLPPPYPTAPDPIGPCATVGEGVFLGYGETAEPLPLIPDLDLMDDGVVFFGPFPWLACTNVSVQVTVVGGGILSAWKDGNLDGDFADVRDCGNSGMVSEWIIQDVPVGPGVHLFTFKDPGMDSDVPYAGIFRFRLCNVPMGAAGWMGGHCETGEVEDYIIEGLQLPVELTAAPTVTAGDCELTLGFNVSDETDVTAYKIYRDGVEVKELPVGNGTYSYLDKNLINNRLYNYTIIAVGLNERVDLSYEGKKVWSGSPSFLNATVTEYALHQNYPNPFNPATEIVYDVLETGVVTLKVYNVMGQEVATLVNGTVETGRYATTFDATGLTSGLYFYTITIGDKFTATKKMLLVQ